MTTAQTFSQFLRTDDPGDAGYLVGYTVVNGVQKEVRIPYPDVAAIGQATQTAVSAANMAEGKASQAGASASAASTAASSASGSASSASTSEENAAASAAAAADTLSNSVKKSAVDPDGASGLGYVPGYDSAEAAIVSALLDTLPSVFMWGAKGDGADQTAAFSLAAANAPAFVFIGPATTVPRPDTAIINIGPGDYVLSSAISAAGRNVIWRIDPSARITGVGYLPGKYTYGAMRSGGETFATADYATIASFIANAGNTQGARVSEYTSTSAMSTYTSRDSVAVYAENTLKAPLATIPNTGCTYSATGASFPTPVNTSGFKKGMLIDTAHTPTKYSSVLKSWTSTSIEVDNWYLCDGSGTPSTPPNGTGFYVSPINKVWAHNANVFIENGALSGGSGNKEATGFEMGLFNRLTSGSPVPLLVGFDVIPLDAGDAKFAVWGRGPTSGSTYGFQDTFVSWRHGTSGFRAQYGRSGSVNFRSIGQGENSEGTYTNCGFYDYKSAVSMMLQPATGGNALLVRAPDGATNRFQLESTGKVSLRSTDSSRAISAKSQDDLTEYWGVRPTGEHGPFALSNVSVTAASYTVTGGNARVICASGSSGGTVTLVSAVVFPGREVQVVNRSGGSVTVAAPSGQTIDGSASVSVANGTNRTFASDGANWLQLT